MCMFKGVYIRVGLCMHAHGCVCVCVYVARCYNLAGPPSLQEALRSAYPKIPPMLSWPLWFTPLTLWQRAHSFDAQGAPTGILPSLGQESKELTVTLRLQETATSRTVLWLLEASCYFFFKHQYQFIRSPTFCGILPSRVAGHPEPCYFPTSSFPHILDLSNGFLLCLFPAPV